MGRRAGTPWARVLGVALVATLAAASALASGAEAQDSWREVAPMRKARSGLAAGMVGGKLYALGGYEYPDTLDTVEVYDPATNTWAAVAPMPTSRYSLAAGVVQGRKLYALGGSGSGGSGGSDKALDTVEVYDPDTDTWAAVAPMPTARDGLAAAVVNGKPYALGGRGVTTSLDTVEGLGVPAPSSSKNTVIIAAAAGGAALLASLAAAAMYIKRRRALYRQQAARLTMARGSASPSLASV